MIRYLLASALLIGLCFLGAGCGYRVVQYQPDGGSAPSICVITLENGSNLPGLELTATEAIRKTIVNRGGLRLVPEPSEADYVLRGRVLPVEIRSRTFTGVVLALEYSVDMSLVAVIQAKEGPGLKLSAKDLNATDLYVASADLEAGRKNREETLRRLSQLLAMRIHDVMDQKLLMGAVR